jgi:hypothetical protein
VSERLFQLTNGTRGIPGSPASAVFAVAGVGGICSRCILGAGDSGVPNNPPLVVGVEDSSALLAH